MLRILNECGIKEDRYKSPLLLAARWHDAGKAHPVFQQAAVGDSPDADRSVLWGKSGIGSLRYARRGFRHEMASALAMLENGLPDLAAYLVAAHHGKVRLSIRSLPHESRPEDPSVPFARGIWEGDEIPSVDLGDGIEMPPTKMDLSYMAFGEGPKGQSWLARMLALRDDPDLGPFRLAYLRLFYARRIGWRVKRRWTRMPEHTLTGCTSRPLTGYLKAMGILRLTAEQKDPQIKGWWKGERFCIETSLDENELAYFFCEEYEPTPITSPWNGGSGFYHGDAKDGIEALMADNHKRFDRYREAVSLLMEWPDIPIFNTVEDLQQTLLSTLKDTKDPKKQNEIAVLINGIESAIQPLQDMSGRQVHRMELTEIEDIANQKGNENQQLWKNLWSVLKKARTKCNDIKRNENKKVLKAKCRAMLPETSLPWLDAVYALKEDSSAGLNPVLGTGGNEGRLEFNNNFIKQLAELFITGDPEKKRVLFGSSVFQSVIPDLWKAQNRPVRSRASRWV